MMFLEGIYTVVLLDRFQLSFFGNKNNAAGQQPDFIVVGLEEGCQVCVCGVVVYPTLFSCFFPKLTLFLVRHSAFSCHFEHKS